MRALDPARRIARAIGRVGATAVLIEGAEETPFAASVQPIRRTDMRGALTGSWGVDRARRRRAILYAPWGEVASRLDVNSSIIWRGEQFRTVQVETLTLEGRPLYIWAILEPEGAERQWT